MAAAVVAAPVALTAVAGCGADEGTPREFVIVALGDSYGSGEGAPEVPGRFAYDPALRRWTGTAATWTAGDEDAGRCHRSPLSGFERAAAKLHSAFAPHDVTVVFRSFACSGAAVRFSVNPVTGLRERPTVSGGVLFPSRGTAGPPGATPPGAQVSQAQAFLGSANKRADAVVMSAGGNDLGYTRVIFLCAVAEYLGESLAGAIGLRLPAGACQFDPGAIAVVAGAIAPTTAGPPRDALPERARGCAFLTEEQVVEGRCTPTFRASLDLLGMALRGIAPKTFIRCNPAGEAAAEATRPFAVVGTVVVVAGTRCQKRAPNSPTRPLGVWVTAEATYPRLVTTPARVYITDYPDPLQDENGAACDGKPDDDLATQQLSRDESAWLRATLRPLLNGEVAAAATRNGWTLVRLRSAARHGICATRTTRWFNTNSDALPVQGEDIDLPRAPGALAEPAISNGYSHPNEAGYEALYVDAVAAAIRSQICAKYAITVCPPIP